MPKQAEWILWLGTVLSSVGAGIIIARSLPTGSQLSAHVAQDSSIEEKPTVQARQVGSQIQVSGQTSGFVTDPLFENNSLPNSPRLLPPVDSRPLNELEVQTTDSPENPQDEFREELQAIAPMFPEEAIDELMKIRDVIEADPTAPADSSTSAEAEPPLSE